MNEQFRNITKHPAFPAVIGVAAFGGGLGLGYILGKRAKPVIIPAETHKLPDQMELNFKIDELKRMKEAQAQPEVVEEVIVTETIEVEDDDEDEVIDESVAEKIKESMTSSHEPEPELETHNIFSDENEKWDYEKEIAARTPNAPYILHKDEFWADEMNFNQSTLTYYAGDDILADEDDHPIYNHTDVVGPLKFGYGSGDPNVFYVRNEKRRSEYEIVRIGALFSEEVLGLEIENNERVKDIKHSKMSKFKLD